MEPAGARSYTPREVATLVCRAKLMDLGVRKSCGRAVDTYAKVLGCVDDVWTLDAKLSGKVAHVDRLCHRFIVRRDGADDGIDTRDSVGVARVT